MGKNNEFSLGFTNRQQIKDEYFSWLCNRISYNPDTDYYILLGVIHKYSYHWKIRNDDNRQEDGLRLREEFCEECDYRITCLNGYCSVLEMLVALSDRIADITGQYAGLHFWEMIHNLGLSNCTDDLYPGLYYDNQINIIMYRLVDRMYLRSGEGGLFPLKYPKKDQRKVELWFQMQAYLLENYNIED